MTAPTGHRPWCDPAHHEADGSCRSAPVVVRDRSVFAVEFALWLYQAADSEIAYLELMFTTGAGRAGGFAVAAESAAELGYVMRGLARQAVAS